MVVALKIAAEVFTRCLFEGFAVVSLLLIALRH